VDVDLVVLVPFALAALLITLALVITLAFGGTAFVADVFKMLAHCWTLLVGICLDLNSHITGTFWTPKTWIVSMGNHKNGHDVTWRHRNFCKINPSESECLHAINSKTNNKISTAATS